MRGLTDDEDDDDDYVNSGMDANNYHNKAVEYACRGKTNKQLRFAWRGLNTSLLMWIFLQTQLNIVLNIPS